MDPIDQRLQNKLASASITLAIELDSAFKLYSFRIIEPERYIEGVKQVVKEYHETMLQAQAEWEESQEREQVMGTENGQVAKKG